MDELDGHGAFATAVAQRFVEPDRTSPRRTRQGRRSRAVLRPRRGAGQDEAVVAGDRVVEPIGTRHRAEEEEHEREGKAIAVVQRDGLELSVLAVEPAISLRSRTVTP